MISEMNNFNSQKAKAIIESMAKMGNRFENSSNLRQIDSFSSWVAIMKIGFIIEFKCETVTVRLIICEKQQFKV
jgi:hypothetical protein